MMGETVLDQLIEAFPQQDAGLNASATDHRFVSGHRARICVRANSLVPHLYEDAILQSLTVIPAKAVIQGWG